MRILLSISLLLFSLSVFAQGKKQKKMMYESYITNADSAFGQKNYTVAREQYRLANGVRPKEEYPKTRMQECDQKAAVQAVEYRGLIRQADSCFALKNWIAAKTFYLQAIAVKPADAYPRDQAKTCNYNISAKNAMEINYKNAIAQGDSCFALKSWACAKANYEAAMKIKPGEIYPQQQLKMCEPKITTAVNEEQYSITISDADDKFNAGNYSYAKQLYEEALKLKPSSSYAKDRIAACEQKLKDGQ